MKTVTVPAIKAFTYQGRAVSPGDLVTMSPVDASLAHRQGQVSLTRGYRVAAMKAAEPEPDPTPVPDIQPEPEAEPRRRRYRRRDMVAEGSPE